MARVLVTRRLPGTALDRLRDAHETTVWDGDEPPSRAELLDLVKDRHGLLSMLTDAIDDELLDTAPDLEAVANYAVGTDNVDLEATSKRGVQVGNTPDVLTNATADIAFALLLAVARRLPAAAQSVRDGAWARWEPEGFLGLELDGATIAVVGGGGRIGSAMATRAEAFGMRVELVGRDDDLHAALATADVVSLHVPLTPDTHHLIDDAALSACRRGALLVNTTRGPVVDQEALARALTSGQLGGAGLDVTDPEPLPADDPLLEAPNLLVLPHIGSATHRAREAMADRAVDNLLAALDGRPMPYAVAP